MERSDVTLIRTAGGIRRTLIWLAVFAIAFGFVESGVVIYLRSIYYPGGFSFPLKLMSRFHLGVELVREAATMVMLMSSAVLCGGTRWQKFGWFIVAFGIWDISYYVWLKVILDWPATPFDPDVLFLIPVPWVGPVIAPIAISLLMIACGWRLNVVIAAGKPFQPGLLSWTLGICATAVLLFSFVRDAGAAIDGLAPAPYPYSLLILSILLLVAAFLSATIRRTLTSPARHD